MPYRIVIIDNNKAKCESISLLLKTVKEFEVTQTYTRVPDCMLEIRHCQPDLVLMDMDITESTVVNAVKQIKKELPSIQVLLQTVYEEDENVFNCICAGASGYILKQEAGSQLITIIKELKQGRNPMSPAFARKVLTRMQEVPFYIPPQPTEDSALSPKEKEVLAYMVNGLSYKIIADQLYKSIDTVHTHVRKIYQKLQVASFTSMVH